MLKQGDDFYPKYKLVTGILILKKAETTVNMNQEAASYCCTNARNGWSRLFQKIVVVYCWNWPSSLMLKEMIRIVLTDHLGKQKIVAGL